MKMTPDLPRRRMDRPNLQKKPTQKICPADQLQAIITDSVTWNDLNLRKARHTDFYLKSPNLTVSNNFPKISSTKFYKLLKVSKIASFTICPN